MKVVFTAAGGGHFAPALAVYNILPKDWEVLFIGRKYSFEADKTHSFEYTTAEKLHIPFFPIHAARLQRNFNKHTLPSLFRFPGGFVQAYKKLQEYKPDIVVSFGGYVSLPVVLAAWILHIPIVIHEQTLQAGLANQIAARFAKVVCVSWEKSKAYFPKGKVTVTGNPLKIDDTSAKDFFTAHPLASDDEKLPLLYITGGSLGSHHINMLISEMVEKLVEKYVIIHQTGDAQEFQDFAMLSQIREKLPKEKKDRYILTKFVDPYEVASILQKATLVVSRSGMSTVTELLSFGKPALFIPLPFAQNNEQMENALFFKKQGLGEIFEQEGLTSEKLFEYIVSMITHIQRYTHHAERAKQVVITHGAAHILEVLQKVVVL